MVQKVRKRPSWRQVHWKRVEGHRLRLWEGIRSEKGQSDSIRQSWSGNETRFRSLDEQMSLLRVAKCCQRSVGCSAHLLSRCARTSPAARKTPFTRGLCLTGDLAPDG